MMQSSSSDDCIYYYNIEIFNLFGPQMQLINIKPIIKNKLGELLSALKKFKAQSMLVLKYKNRNDNKIIHSGSKLIPSDSNIDQEFKSKHQSIMTKTKKVDSENWVVLDVIIKHSFKISEC